MGQGAGSWLRLKLSRLCRHIPKVWLLEQPVLSHICPGLVCVGEGQLQE